MYKSHTELIEPFGIKRTQDSSSEPISLAEAKSFLRVTHNNDDSFITSLITACRQSLEITTRRCLSASQSYEVSYCDFPTSYFKLILPNPPITTFSSLKYYNVDGVLTTVDSNSYIHENNGNGVSFLAMLDTYSKPTLHKPRIAPVVASYVSGYTSSTLPEPLKQAMLLLIAHYYDTREIISYGDIPYKIQRTVDFISEQYKIRKF
tara:strand:- start:15877 stop:16494 length:618 start_codon:yes stop_codon:yes gene_type:complete